MLLVIKNTAVYNSAGSYFRSFCFSCVNVLSLVSRKEEGNWKEIYIHIYTHTYISIYIYIDMKMAGGGLLCSVFSKRISLLMPRGAGLGAHKWRSVMLMGNHTVQPHTMVLGPGCLLVFWRKKFISEAQREPFHQLELDLDQAPEKAVFQHR